ncbi:MAG: hypothetical protein LBF60_03560 [Treponema sp.]|nr:hypothetical protein [Treponema sp.]
MTRCRRRDGAWWSRFPGKPLLDIAGKPMIQRVWENVRIEPIYHNAMSVKKHPVYDYASSLYAEGRGLA